MSQSTPCPGSVVPLETFSIKYWLNCKQNIVVNHNDGKQLQSSSRSALYIEYWVHCKPKLKHSC